MKLSTGIRNHLLSGGSFKSGLDGGEVRIYSGPPPASPDDAVTGTLLVTVKNGGSGVTFAAAAGGVMTKTLAETWSGTNVATDAAGYYRLVLPADTGASSSSALRVQGTVGVAGADLNLSSVALTSGGTQSIDAFSVAMPIGS